LTNEALIIFLNLKFFNIFSPPQNSLVYIDVRAKESPPKKKFTQNYR